MTARHLENHYIVSFPLPCLYPFPVLLFHNSTYLRSAGSRVKAGKYKRMIDLGMILRCNEFGTSLTALSALK